MKLCYMTWVYPSAEIYFEQYVNSLNLQRFKGIDLIFLDNGVDVNLLKYLEDSLYGFNSLKIVNLEKGVDFKNILVHQLKMLKTNGYNVVIFGDIDDTFSPLRFKSYNSAVWEDYAFMYNDLKHMYSDKSVFGHLPMSVSTINDIKSKNFIGMSMSALNIGKIDFGIFEPQEISEIVAFDWYIYSKLLINGFCGKLLENADTYYRIYPHNIAGDPEFLTHSKLVSNLVIRDKHFKVFSDYHDDFNYLQSLNTIFVDKLIKDKSLYGRYYKFYNKKKHKLWWDLKIEEFLDNEQK